MSEQLNPRWEPRKLDELGFVGRGKSKHRPRNDPSLYDGHYPFFQTADVKAADLYLRDYSQTYNEKGLAQSKLWEPGTLCITIAANIAETAILAVRGCFPDSVVGFVAEKRKADARFVKYYIDTIKMQMQSASLGTTQDNLSLDKLLTFDILTPALPTQRKIASILSAYDDLIENNTRRIRILEEMAQAIYREWFVHFRFPGRKKVALVPSPLGPIPEGWNVARLSDLVDTQYGYTASATMNQLGPKFVRGMDINKKSFIDWTSVPFCKISDEDHSKYRLGEGDVLVIRMADPGKAGIVEKAVDAVFASYLIRLKPKSRSLTPYFLFHFLLSERYQDYIAGASTGTTRKSASAGVITKIDLVVPPERLLGQFEERVVIVRSMLNNLLDRSAVLRRIRDYVLPRLISGDLDVSDLDINVGDAAA